jgi:hypothetical protein
MFIKTTMAVVAALVLAGSLGSVLVAQAQSQIGNGTPAELYGLFYGPSEAPVDLPKNLHPKAKASR